MESGKRINCQGANTITTGVSLHHATARCIKLVLFDQANEVKFLIKPLIHLAAVAFSASAINAPADWTDATCEISPKGDVWEVPPPRLKEAKP